jgi:hypothetical protein
LKQLGLSGQRLPSSFINSFQTVAHSPKKDWAPGLVVWTERWRQRWVRMDRAAQHQNNPPQSKWASRALLPCSSSLISSTQQREGSESNNSSHVKDGRPALLPDIDIYHFQSATSRIPFRPPPLRCPSRRTHCGPPSSAVGPRHSIRPPSAAAQKTPHIENDTEANRPTRSSCSLFRARAEDHCLSSGQVSSCLGMYLRGMAPSFQLFQGAHTV